VNGPGEALMTDMGITGGGRGTHQIYVGGLTDHRLQDEDIVEHLARMIEAKAAEIEAAAEDETDTAGPVRGRSAAAS
jgi:(E)-4-hydroxy-3-methylbut-2-enyl-diphosphate synthase